jgi:hypothetical protein
MSQSLEQLKRLLAEVFQLDHAELDFGIYRIMNTKREEIVRFLDRDLLPQVREAGDPGGVVRGAHDAGERALVRRVQRDDHDERGRRSHPR